MRLLDEDDALELRELLGERLQGPVRLEYYRRPAPADGSAAEGEPCDEGAALMAEVAALSPNITLVLHEEPAAAGPGEAAPAPAIVLTGRARGRVRFFGLPTGYGFGSFIQQLIDVGNGRTDLAQATRDAVRDLSRDVHIQVFVTPTCPFCPAAARLAQKMAVESARVTADVIEANEFPELSDRYDVQGVPKVVVNEVIHILGAQPEARFLQSVLRAAA